MKIERIELREIKLPLVTPFETSFGRTYEREIVLVKVYGAGEHGWGECTVGENPFYNHEWANGAWTLIRDFVAPMVLGKSFDQPEDVPALTNKIRGNKMARAAVECAVWDLAARQQGKPLWQLLGGVQEEINCGVSLGLEDTDAAMLKKVEKEVAAGYQRIKIKIKPGRDYEMIKTLRKEYPTITMSVDANSAYSLNDVALLKKMDEFKLLMIEQPLAYDDILDHAELQPQLQTAICLDESILSEADARKALALKACRIINVKLGRVSGHTEARKVQAYCHARHIPVWCGGMLEAGIGRAHNIHMSTLPGFTLPGDVSASKRYWTEDIITPEVTVSPQGKIARPAGVGLGYEVNEKRIEALTVRTETITA
ncbi:MAG: o-succinylbenzoate synthase [Acidobacteria bacterium]|nr:o-succinylbenzoate synthase [Acidobacteriota bacterium]